MKAILIWAGLVIALVIAALFGIGVFLSPENDLQKADAIIAVSGGDTRARTLEAVALATAALTTAALTTTEVESVATDLALAGY